MLVLRSAAMSCARVCDTAGLPRPGSARSREGLNLSGTPAAAHPRRQRQRGRLQAAAAAGGGGDERRQSELLSRRSALLAAAACLAPAAWQPPQAAASGILQFPVMQLSNEYFLVRAGQSEAEAEGFIFTNPGFKTSTIAGLSSEGKRQVVKSTWPQLKELGLDSAAWFYASITQNSYQTAEVLAALQGVGRNRVVGEFSFLDARGVGQLERLPLGEAAAALAAGDSLSPTWRPNPNVDGTVHESANDVLVRVRQLLSLLETQYQGQSVIIVSPDSDNLSVLQAAVLGVDLRSHRAYSFEQGEARRLQLSDAPPPEPPGSFACPRPPQCV